MSETKQKLKPCPFCEGRAEMKHSGAHFGASCSDWKCQGMQGALMHRDELSAAAAWNRRAPAPKDDKPCSQRLRLDGKAYPRTCMKCGLGPCREGSA